MEAAFADWNRFSSTTKVVFEPAQSGVPADLEIKPSDDPEMTGGCAGYDEDTISINYSQAFVERAANSSAAGATVLAHELGHFLGLGEAGENPGTPSIMNNPVIGPN
ncbi:MAG: hypothetical protein ACXW3C_18755, partial [Pyrinomonadaceae bacterium]